MDKRYFLIIIIFILGCLCMFMVEESSDIIGSASVSFDGYTFSIPNGFTLMNTYDTSIIINNPKTGLFISIYTLEKDSSAVFRLLRLPYPPGSWSGLRFLSSLFYCGRHLAFLYQLFRLNSKERYRFLKRFRWTDIQCLNHSRVFFGG